jgi:hypothetical protein
MSRLDSLHIATPCPMKFSQMKGDDRVRFCGQCKQHVYDLSAMTEAEAVKLVTVTEKRVCVTFFRRDDGTVLTRDCEGGFSKHFWAKFGTFERKGMMGLAAAAVISVLFAGLVTIFGDNIRALFGAQTTGLVADTRPATKPHRETGKMVRPSNGTDQGY